MKLRLLNWAVYFYIPLLYQGTIDPKLAKHPAWKSRLIIGIINSVSDITRLPTEYEESQSENGNQKNFSDTHGFVIPTKSIFNKYEQYIRGSLKNGRLDGFVQIFGKMTADPNGHCSSNLFSGLSFVGWLKDGKPIGKVIKMKNFKCLKQFQ